MTRTVVIAGMGEVGRRVAEGARREGWAVREVRRGEALSDAIAEGQGPVVLAMREDDFEAPFREAIRSRSRDVVLLQNGFIDEVIAGHDVTRGVLWFTAKGDFFESARETVVGGPWAHAVAAWVRAAGAPARAVTDSEARREGREKAAWSCLVGPGVAAWKLTFAEMLERDERAAKRIVEEACDVATRALGEAVSRENAWRMVRETAGPLGWMRGGIKGLAWRSGKVVEWAERLGDGYAAVTNGEVVRRLLAG